jgi:hypothetical protein
MHSRPNLDKLPKPCIRSHETCSLVHTPAASEQRQTAVHSLSAVSTAAKLATLQCYTGKSGYRRVKCRVR